MKSRFVRIASLSALAVLLSNIATAQLPPVFSGREVPLVPDGDFLHEPLAVADMDLDGKPDLVTVGSLQAGLVSGFCVTRSLGDSTFAPPKAWPLPITHAIEDLAVGSVDGDPWPDVAVCTGNQRVWVARGAPGNLFGPPAEYFVGSGPLLALALVDVNRDGTNDLLTGTTASPGWINVNLADGTGGYLPTASWAAGHEVWDLAAGDLTGDSWTDVVSIDLFGDTLAVLVGDGAGGFLAPVVMACEPQPREVLLGRLDGDGDLDVLIAASNDIGLDGSVCAWLNDGGGGLSPGILAWPGKYTLGAALHDLDGDGDLDVVAANGSSRDVSLLLNDGTGRFDWSAGIPAGLGPHAVAVFDATGDGVRDILAVAPSWPAALFPALADGSFSAPAIWGTTSHPMSVDVARLDDDAWLDVLFVTATTVSIGTLLGTPDGFALPPTLHSGFGQVVAARAGDLDGDARPDAVAVNGSFPRVTVGQGTGDGAFVSPTNYAWTATPANGDSLALADLDDDGWLDVVASTQGAASHVVTLRNLGAGGPGQLALGVPWPTSPYAYTLAVADLDGDGAPDAVTVHPPASAGLPSSLVALPGDGAGGLAPPIVSVLPPTADPAVTLGLADMDLDGLLDAVAGIDDGSLALAYGDGTGALLASAIEPAHAGAAALAVGDADGDGWPDVLHGGNFGGAPTVLRRGDGAGGLQPPETYAAFGTFRALVLADLTLDGRPELLAATHDDILGKQGHVRAWDNLVADFTWTDLGHALAGLHEPRLTGTGELRPGTPGRLLLAQAAPVALAAAFIAPWEQPTPFQHGTLVPVPPLLTLYLVTDAHGRIELPWSSWPSDNPGATWAFQLGVLDAGAAGGVTLSNALRGTEPM
jgi:hypothetical protein